MSKNFKLVRDALVKKYPGHSFKLTRLPIDKDVKEPTRFLVTTADRAIKDYYLCGDIVLIGQSKRENLDNLKSCGYGSQHGQIISFKKDGIVYSITNAFSSEYETRPDLMEAMKDVPGMFRFRFVDDF